MNFRFATNLPKEKGTAACVILRRPCRPRPVRYVYLGTLLFFLTGVPSLPEWNLNAKTTAGAAANQQEADRTLQSPEHPETQASLESTEDWNRRLRGRSASASPMASAGPREYAIGPEDVLDINVFEAQEMNREVRVSASGEISLPLLGAVRAAGLTPRELETTLQDLLHQKYMKDPHIGVFVREMQSHPVSVMGAVRRPGVFQIRGSKTLLEVLSLAEGLADDAGETVIILRGAALSAEPDSPTDHAAASDPPSPGPQSPGEVNAASSPANDNRFASEGAVHVNLKDLLESADSRSNPLVHPGDIVKVTRAGVVYVIGEVRKPGGFVLKSNEKISVLQALALSEGLTPTASKGNARIIRTDQQSGERKETPINLGKILAGKAPDPVLGPKDIVFVPNSAAKTTFGRGAEVAAQTLAGLLIFHW